MIRTVPATVLAGMEWWVRSASQIGGIAALALLGMGLIAVMPAPAKAASPLCERLEARLASVSGAQTSRNPALARRYRVAIGEQKRQMRIAERRARQMGCDGVFTRLRSAEAGRCTRISDSLRSMRSNLAELQRRLETIRPGNRGAETAERRRILAAIRANRCREEPKQRVVRRLPDSIATARRDHEMRKRLFEREEDGDNGSVMILQPGFSGMFQGGTYRTLCVRTCDGYYFPMSFSTTPDFFYRDQDACQARCPGVDVQLYVHRSGTEEPEDMVSLGGQPYTQLPSAFAYRAADFTRPQGCACNPAKNYAVIGKDDKPQSVPPDDVSIPVPARRPDPAADPETRSGQADELPKKNMAGEPGERDQPDDGEAERRVRVVGPTFLPDPEEALDLKAPDPNAVR